MISAQLSSFFFFFNDTATTEIYTLSLHDALPISPLHLLHTVLTRLTFRQLEYCVAAGEFGSIAEAANRIHVSPSSISSRSEEHTSELQSRLHLVCRLLLEKKNREPTSIVTASHHTYE